MECFEMKKMVISFSVSIYFYLSQARHMLIFTSVKNVKNINKGRETA
jgi:hypothetical protein